jgi:hypothetical protein
MAINRRFLYAGLFLVALGGVLVLVDLAAVDTAAVSSALRLWPLAIIAIGAGIVFRRSRYALVAGVLAALVPGLVLGGGLAVAPRHSFDCGEQAAPSNAETQRGSFSGPATVELEANCGSLAIGTQPGSAWQLTTSNTAGRLPIVHSNESALQVVSYGHDDWEFGDTGRDSWALALPTTELDRLAMTVNAGRASLALPGATVNTLLVTGNAADISVDATQATIADLNATLNFGRLSIRLPAQGLHSGAVRLGAGQLLLCVPFGLGMHVQFTGTPREVRVNGLVTDGSIWESEGYASASSRADLSVKVNFGSVLINPIGGCK